MVDVFSGFFNNSPVIWEGEWKKKNIIFFLLFALFYFGFIGPFPAEAIVVNNVTELINAVDLVNSGSSDKTIELADGTYRLPSGLWITADGVTVKSLSGKRRSVAIEGEGFYGGVTHIFLVRGRNFTAKDMTIRNVANHCIQIQGEENADNPHLKNLIIQDGYEQLVKVSFMKSKR